MLSGCCAYLPGSTAASGRGASNIPRSSRQRANPPSCSRGLHRSATASPSLSPVAPPIAAMLRKAPERISAAGQPKQEKWYHENQIPCLEITSTYRTTAYARTIIRTTGAALSTPRRGDCPTRARYARRALLPRTALPHSQRGRRPWPLEPQKIPSSTLQIRPRPPWWLNKVAARRGEALVHTQAVMGS
eukprot:4123848-Pleurochrysis_carterae.AAC.3